MNGIGGVGGLVVHDLDRVIKVMAQFEIGVASEAVGQKCLQELD